METKPRVSVVTISYNQAAFIARAIRSIVEQDYTQKEYIVIDPGSTDGSRDIIARFAPKIDRLILEPDNGPADGLNKGFEMANGEILGYVNSDDALLPGALVTVTRAFAQHPEIDVFQGSGFIVDENDSVLREIVPSKFTLRRFLYGGATIFQPATFFRRTAFERVGGFNVENRTCWDAELLQDMAANGARFGCLRNRLAIFRIHPGSITGSRLKRVEFNRDQARLFRKVMQREKSDLDRVIGLGYRLFRLLENPAHLMWHVGRVFRRLKSGAA